MTDEIHPAEWPDCGCKDYEEHDSRKSADQWRPKQTKSQCELRHSRHWDEHITRHPESEKWLLDNQRRTSLGRQTSPDWTTSKLLPAPNEALQSGATEAFQCSLVRGAGIRRRQALTQGSQTNERVRNHLARRSRGQQYRPQLSAWLGERRCSGDHELQPGNPFRGSLQIGCEIDAANGENCNKECGNDRPDVVVLPPPKRAGGIVEGLNNAGSV